MQGVYGMWAAVKWTLPGTLAVLGEVKGRRHTCKDGGGELGVSCRVVLKSGTRPANPACRRDVYCKACGSPLQYYI
jgi:hypothetical protein